MATLIADHRVTSKNLALLAEFSQYCAANPSQRFWQALRNWSGARCILWVRPSFVNTGAELDTFNWDKRSE